jgi:hypothetical protein
MPRLEAGSEITACMKRSLRNQVRGIDLPLCSYKSTDRVFRPSLWFAHEEKYGKK